MRVLFAACFVLLTSCSSGPRCCYNVLGADQFVVDSYKIRQGKLAIMEMEGEEVPCLPHDTMVEYRDEIINGDVLNIIVYHPDRTDIMGRFQFVNEKIGGFRVRNGAVDLPDVGLVELSGLSLDEAQDIIEADLQHHFDNMSVFISYKKRPKRKVDLAGMVGVHSIPVDGKMRLHEVLTEAKVNPNANLFMSHVSRDGEHLPIDLNRLISVSDMSQNIVMRGGDKIFIANPSDATVTVMGEVGTPASVNLPRGSISLREALVAAKGIPFTGDRNRIQVIRGSLQDPKIYALSWEHLIHLPNDSLLLMPGDTVFVSETPITQWNRFIEQLLPTVRATRDIGDTRSKYR